jgi:hypothetical protein
MGTGRGVSKQAYACNNSKFERKAGMLSNINTKN